MCILNINTIYKQQGQQQQQRDIDSSSYKSFDKRNTMAFHENADVEHEK